MSTLPGDSGDHAGIHRRREFRRHLAARYPRTAAAFAAMPDGPQALAAVSPPGSALAGGMDRTAPKQRIGAGAAAVAPAGPAGLL